MEIERKYLIKEIPFSLEAYPYVFEGLYQGLIYAEVEFETKEDADNFAAPAWFTRDVSMDGAYHNSALSSMNEEQRLAFMARVFGH